MRNNNNLELNHLQNSSMSDSVNLNIEGNIAIIEIDNKYAKAKIATLGGHVISFIPKNDINKDILWLSDESSYDGSKPLRGGIPICWPWFGDHPTDTSKPVHGFVNSMVWDIDTMTDLENGQTEICLFCEPDEESTLENFYLELKITIGKSLNIALTTHNFSDENLEITQAFHSYFATDNANDINITGLDSSQEFDKLNPMPVKTQQGILNVNAPIDSVFLNQKGKITVEEKGSKQSIELETNNTTSSCIVWNPGKEIVKKFTDINNAKWSHFICVETGNVLDNASIIPPASKNTMQLNITVI